MSSNQPVVMVVAGGSWQVPLIAKLKELGAFVVNTNLYPDSIGFKYADVGLVADVKDIEANLRFAKEYRPDAILTDQSDIAVPTVAKLCEELDLPGIGYNIALRFTNKAIMREYCSEKGLFTLKYRICRTESEVLNFIDNIKKPVVIKPPDNQSSRGVHKVADPKYLREAFRDALKQTRLNWVLVEEYINGIEFTVEGIKTPNKHKTLAISVKDHFDHNPMIAKRLVFSNEIEGINFDRLMRENDHIIETMQLPFGLTHAEYKFYNDQFYLMEVAARGGGTKISSHIVPILSNIDTYAVLLKLAMGRKVEDLPHIKTEMAVLLEFFEFQSGTVKSITGLEKAKSLPGLIDMEINFSVGDFIRESADDRSRHMHVITAGKNVKNAIEIANQARDKIEVTYEKNTHI